MNSNYPLHSLAHSLRQFVADKLVPMVDAADEGSKQKDLAALVIHSLNAFADQSMKVGEMLVAADEKAERSDVGINTLHILSHSLTQCLEENLQRLVAEAPEGADKAAGLLVNERIEEFINTLNETANTLQDGTSTLSSKNPKDP